MNLDLTAHNALVCGASRGIGAATAHALASLGANVIAVARGHARLQETVNGLPCRDVQKHRALELDLMNDDAVAVAIDELARLPVHILINNSGGPPPGPVSGAGKSDFEKALHQHLFANHALVTGLAPGMARAGYGRVINIISTSVKEPIKGLGVSNTVRAAVGSWAKTLAGELGERGITVNNVLPGFTETERLAEIFGNRSRASGIPLEKIEQAARAEVPLGRFAEPAEIGNVVAFLASPAAAYINGTNVVVDGGRTRSL